MNQECQNSESKLVGINTDQKTEPPDNPLAVTALQSDADKLIKAFEVQVLMSAGPRKRDAKDDDIEYGEDAAGVVLLDDVCYFWIADGTTDEMPVNGNIKFNAKDLAFELGSSFAEYVKEVKPAKQFNCDARQVLEKILERVLNKWNKDILAGESASLMREAYDVSAVFLCGWLTNKGVLEASCYGDAWLANRNSDEKWKVFDGTHGRFFLRWTGNEWKTSTKHLISDPIKCDGVTCLLVGSDGVKPPLNSLLEQQDSRSPDIRSIHNLLRKRDGVKTWDDKALCVVNLT